jgi:short-subunit dehydrogenase involved in D-alanine esterification of teichoic acids
VLTNINTNLTGPIRMTSSLIEHLKKSTPRASLVRFPRH